MNAQAIDALTDARGQAHLIAVLVIAMAAVAISGLRGAQERILDDERVRRAGEAAVEAATAVVADAYVAANALPSPLPADIARAVLDPATRERARAAAIAMSFANGGADLDGPEISCASRGVDVKITIAGRIYRAGFDGSCSRR